MPSPARTAPLLLADHGAAVYKAESPDEGDIGRGWGPPFVGNQASYFIGLNLKRGARSECIDSVARNQTRTGT